MRILLWNIEKNMTCIEYRESFFEILTKMRGLNFITILESRKADDKKINFLQLEFP